MPDRRWGDGFAPNIVTKKITDVKKEVIPYQVFFLLCKLSGMAGRQR
jgi:hypothetical protein